jgi:hypothetical protein
MGIRQSLVNLGLCGVLALGAVGLTGCNSGFNSVRGNQPAAFYSRMEDRVYNLVDSFSREIPKEFVKMESANSFYDSSLKVPPGPNPKEEDMQGEGRFVTKNYTMINAGYMAAEEVKAAKKSGDARSLKKVVGFVRKLNTEIESLGIMQDCFTFMEGNQGVMYLKIAGEWKRKDFTFKNVGKYAESDLKEVMAFPTVSRDKVDRYIELAERLDKTYFRGRYFFR